MDVEKEQENIKKEVMSRVSLAKNTLPTIFSQTKTYFEQTLDLLASNYGNSQIKEFQKGLVTFLDAAQKQMTAGIDCFLNSNFDELKITKSPRAKKTYRLVKSGCRDYVALHRPPNKDYVFSFVFHRLSVSLYFPPLLQLRYHDMLALFAGWRASDEGERKGIPFMTTVHPWQVIAYAVTRPGNLRIFLTALNLPKPPTLPTLQFIVVAEDYLQEWPGRLGKKVAQYFIQQNELRLGYLTWFLGDGVQYTEQFKIAIGDKQVALPPQLSREVIDEAYRVGFGQLLDLLNFSKWEILKNFTVYRGPVHAHIYSKKFNLFFIRRQLDLRATARFRTKEDAEAFQRLLKEKGIDSHVTPHWKTRKGKRYIDAYCVNLERNSVLKLAEQNPEWRQGLIKLANKHDLRNLQPRTPTLQRLLELVENPPLQPLMQT